MTESSCGRCVERGQALTRAAKLIGRGEVKAARVEIAEVVRSGVQDASAAFRQKAAVVRQRLSVRR